VVVTLENGKTYRIAILRRALPRGPGKTLFYVCPSCQMPRRYLYRVVRLEDRLVAHLGLRCQVCAGLRFASEGCYKSAAARIMGPFGRTPWDPQAVSDPRIIADECLSYRR